MILTSAAQRRELLLRSRSIAVVGASPNRERPSYGVFEYLRGRPELDVAPVRPAVAEINGARAFPSLAAYAAERGAPDIVDVFRRRADAAAVARAAVAAGAKAIWFQLGVANDEAVRIADESGLDVVAEHCIKVEFRLLDAAPDASPESAS